MTRFFIPALWRRVVWSGAICLTLAASLLVFPSAALWMVACYLICFTGIHWRNGRGWFPLAACVVILIVKRPDWSPFLVALALAMIAVAVLSFRRRSSTGIAPRGFALAPIALLWGLWLIAEWESNAAIHSRRSVALDPNRPIVCLGDSLTTGLSDQAAYPLYLQQDLSVPVISLARAGVTARDTLSQLPALRDANPQAVIIELGGHDFLRGTSEASTRESLVQIIDACREIDAQVVLVEIPRGFIVDAYSGLERELARTFDLELISDTAIRMLVLRSPSSPLGSALTKPYLSDDGLHPNVAGARYLAEVVQATLVRMYGPNVTKAD